MSRRGFILRGVPAGLLVSVLAASAVQAQPYAYVSNEWGDEITVIDVAKGTATPKR